MDPITLVLVWPFLILVIGLVGISLFNLAFFGGFGIFSFLFWVILFVFVVTLLSKASKEYQSATLTVYQQLEQIRKFLVGVSIALLLPIFSRYIIDGFGKNNITGFIISLFLGFGVVVLGMLSKNNKVVEYASITGGALVLLFVFQRVWDLSPVGRVVASAVALVIAITIAVVKLKDKLS